MDTIVILSGGLDSTVLLYQLLNVGNRVAALSVDYGQRHKKELVYARDTATRLGVEHEVADLSQIKRLIAGSSQTSDIAVPHGHYEEESMKLTVVPNRNMIMLSVAIGWAISKKFHRVAYAAHGGDHAVYPDCRKEFVDALATVALLADWHPITMFAPFTEMTKREIVLMGHNLGVPWELTWSCYEGGDVHCGKCGTCVERIEAFSLAHVADPTEYAI